MALYSYALLSFVDKQMNDSVLLESPNVLAVIAVLQRCGSKWAWKAVLVHVHTPHPLNTRRAESTAALSCWSWYIYEWVEDESPIGTFAQQTLSPTSGPTETAARELTKMCGWPWVFILKEMSPYTPV